MPGTHDRNTAVIEVLPATADRPRVMYRYAGDRFILVEYGEMVLDLTMNFRIFGLNDTLKKAELDGLVETVPALRSMLIQYDSRRLPTRMLVDTLKKLEETVPPGENLNIPTIDVISREISFIGNLVGTYNDLVDLMTLTAQGKVSLHTSTYPLEAINDAMADLDNGRLQGRGILIPAGA